MPSIRSSRVVLPGEVRPATITFAEGRIVSIDDGPAAADYGDLVILPGLVDSHVHVNEPGRTDWEGFTTATDAAAAGGTTTIVDMPLNSIPPTTNTAALGAKIRAATGKLAVDVAFRGGLIPGSLENVEALAGEGVCGFKLFLSDSGVPEFPPLGAAEMGSALAALAGVGLPALVHAEDPDLLETLTGDAIPRQGTGDGVDLGRVHGTEAIGARATGDANVWRCIAIMDPTAGFASEHGAPLSSLQY